MKERASAPADRPCGHPADRCPATAFRSPAETSGLRHQPVVPRPESRSVRAAQLMMVAAARSAEELHRRIASTMSGGE